MTLHARHRIESSLAEGLQADFTTDVVGNISAIAGAGGVPVSGYGYDDLYRLTSETAPGLSLAHAYDATGNRTAETVAGATTVYAYPPDSHRLTNIGGTARTFDAAGNLRVLNQGNRSSPEYAYDDRNRLSAYRVGSRDVATYAHNARGERVHKSAPKAGSATLFVYAEGGQLLGEYDADGNVQQEYAWLDALPVAVLKKSGPYPLEPDHLGTPRRAIAAELDRAAWAWDLQGPAFGTHAANDDPDADGQPFPLSLRFPGQYLDTESGLHYNYFRDYEPATGRYVESDPVGLKGGVTTFAYVRSGPLKNVDPQGLVEWSGTLGGAAAIDGIGGSILAFELVSECKCKRRVRVSGYASFLAGGLGLKYTGSGASTAFSDYFECPEESAPNGSAFMLGIAGVLGAGGSCSYVNLGSLYSSSCGPSFGVDISAGMYVGASVVTTAKTECCG